MTKYSDDPAWADVTPLPVDEGGATPLAGIAYSEEYAETTAYLRAVMAADEHSERALELTQDLIGMNPAHYTVWLYRASILERMGADPETELAWLNETALENQKNYQIWHHRQTVVERRGRADGERAFITRMLERDAKNYHVWSYRQWLVRRFELWDDGELLFTEEMLAQDVRNNSAWNHRWFVINGRSAEGVPGVNDASIRERESEFAKAAIEKAPHNQCPWNYLRAVFRRSGSSLTSLRSFVAQYASVERPDAVRSSYALDLMAEILAEAGEDGDGEKAGEALDLLATRFDPIRKAYWQYRKNMLALPATQTPIQA